MAKVTAPFFGLDASGTIADAITYASWRGINYTRRRVIPANPQSAGQVNVRDVFSTLNSMWERSPQLLRDSFQAFIRGLPLTDRNAWIQLNLADLLNDANLQDMVMSRSSGGAVPPAGATFTPGVGTITVAVTAPTVPPGYTLTAAVAAAVLDGDPSPPIERTIVAGEDLTTPYSIVLSGLTASLHRCGAWLRWTRTSDSLVFYSTPIMGSATPT